MMSGKCSTCENLEWGWSHSTAVCLQPIFSFHRQKKLWQFLNLRVPVSYLVSVQALVVQWLSTFCLSQHTARFRRVSAKYVDFKGQLTPNKDGQARSVMRQPIRLLHLSVLFRELGDLYLICVVRHFCGTRNVLTLRAEWVFTGKVQVNRCIDREKDLVVLIRQLILSNLTACPRVWANRIWESRNLITFWSAKHENPTTGKYTFEKLAFLPAGQLNRLSTLSNAIRNMWIGTE